MSKKNEPGMAYDMNKLNKVFAFISVIFLMAVIWVFLDDYLRPWKAVQLEAMQIRRERISQSIEDFQQNLDQQKLEQVKEKIEEANAVVATREEEIKALEDQMTTVSRDLKSETLISGTLSAQVSQLQFQYGNALSKKKPSKDSYFKKLRTEKELFAASQDRLRGFQNQEAEINGKLAELRAEITEAERGRAELLGTLELLEAAKAQTDIDPIFAIRNAPLVDFLDPTVKIEQVVLENVTDDRYFVNIPKVDRCITCHTFIDQEGYEDLPNPHKSHPDLDLMVGANSPHPIKQYGCTTCHGGEGHRVHDFNSAAHTPQDEEQKAEWIKKYSWKEPKYILQPMLPLQHSEASCLKCHEGVEYIPEATVLNEGRQLMEKYGCYGCHKIEGWEHKRMPGPSLERISSKITKDFFKSWVWNPRSFNEHALMPSFFMQENNSKPEYMRKNMAEVNAIADYVWDISKPYKPFMTYRPGDAKRGKELIRDVGCMACHGVEGYEEDSKKVKAYSAPYLTGTGSKVDPDWLVSWLKKPDHYSPDTIMPSFRLTDREVYDIATYLLSLKNEAFERLEFEPMDPQMRDEILLDYFSAFDPVETAQAKLDSMTDREKTLELGQRSIGKYGCYSCHSIEGFSEFPPIGPELTNVGSKPLTQFGFNFVKDVPKTRHNWITAHLIQPSRWEVGMDSPFKDLTRMPNFYLSFKEAETITTALLGQSSEYVPLAGVKRLDADEYKGNEGMKLLNKFQCIACHQVDGEHGNILALYEDDLAQGPPRLVDQGHKMQADWFFHFLDNVHMIRPDLKVRMPSYNLTTEEKNVMAEAFLAMSKQRTFVGSTKVEWEPGERQAARELFDSYACASCHTTGFNNDQALAPNLYLAKKRLRPSWVKDWLLDPQAIYPGTLMPSFWEGGESMDPTILGGDVDKQINALTKYLLEIGNDQYAPAYPKN